MHRNQLIRGVILLGTLTGHNEVFVLHSTSVATVWIAFSSVCAVNHADRLCTHVAVLSTILAGDVGQATGSSHILEGFMQKGVFLFTVPGVIVDTTHCCVALLRTYLYVLNFKPVSLGETLRLSPKWTHWLPQPQQQQERKGSPKVYGHFFSGVFAVFLLRTRAVDQSQVLNVLLAFLLQASLDSCLGGAGPEGFLSP